MVSPGPLDAVTLTVLCENTVGRSPGLIAEWGLSVWIEAGDRCILLDAGEQTACAHNAERMGVDLGRAEAVVVSHGHFDHTGGLAHVLPLMPHARIYLHPDALLPRYAKAPDIQRDATRATGIGMPAASRDALAGRETVSVVEPLEVVPGVWVTGPIPRREPVEGAGGLGFLDPGESEPDPVWDDMALWVETAAGILVVLGCAHAGILNTLAFVRQHADGRPIAALVGGTHLRETTPERMRVTLSVLHSLPLELLAPCHCTGAQEAFELRREFPTVYRSMAVGETIRFPALRD